MEPDRAPTIRAAGEPVSEETVTEETGTHADFAAYVRASERKHKRLAFLLAGDRDAADDLLQAAYARVYPRWEKVRTYDVPDAYLRKVMVSMRTSWWRRSRNREWPVAELPDHSGLGSSGLGTTGHRPAGRDEAGIAESMALRGALRQLPEQQRAAVVLRHWCDLSEADTAATMACLVGAVKSNTSKGLARLRVVLGVPGGEAS